MLERLHSENVPKICGFIPKQSTAQCTAQWTAAKKKKSAHSEKDRNMNLI
jgi:hypothetical protein